MIEKIPYTVNGTSMLHIDSSRYEETFLEMGYTRTEKPEGRTLRTKGDNNPVPDFKSCPGGLGVYDQFGNLIDYGHESSFIVCPTEVLSFPEIPSGTPIYLSGIVDSIDSSNGIVYSSGLQ